MPPFFMRPVALTSVHEVERRHSVLTFSDLKAHLVTGNRLPKDEFLKTNIYGLRANTYRYRDRHFDRAALHALTSSDDHRDHELALRICNCRPGHRCHRLACFICNQRYWRKRRGVADRIAQDCMTDEISWCTVIIGVGRYETEQLKAQIASFKSQFANSLAIFAHVRWSGRIEVDYLDPSITEVKSGKRKTLLALGWEPDREETVLVPHTHVVLVHPGTHRTTIMVRLKKSFPGTSRVEVKALRAKRERAVSLDNMTRYPLKPCVDPAYLAEPRSKNRVPRHPEVVRYMVKLQDSLERPRRHGLMEFDRP